MNKLEEKLIRFMWNFAKNKKIFDIKIYENKINISIEGYTRKCEIFHGVFSGNDTKYCYGYGLRYFVYIK